MWTCPKPERTWTRKYVCQSQQLLSDISVMVGGFVVMIDSTKLVSIIVEQTKRHMNRYIYTWTYGEMDDWKTK